MVIFFNGSFVDEREARISVADRGFLYGDGLFETMRVYAGKPFRLADHWARLQRGAEFLRIRMPYSLAVVEQCIDRLVAENQLADAALRITLSRGPGQRGYSPNGADTPTFVVSLHPVPESSAGLKLHTASVRVPLNDPLAAFKSANKLANVLAKTEAEEHGEDEALMLNIDNKVAQVSSGNIFWVQGGTVHTPPLAAGILPGVTRAVVIERLESSGIPCQTNLIDEIRLFEADGCFITNSVIELAAVTHLDGHPLRQSDLVREIHSQYQELVRKETEKNAS